MSGFQEYPEAAIWLTETLAGIGGITGVWEHPAPELEAFPLITFAEHGQTDVTVIDGHRVWNEMLVLVTVITKGESTLALKPAATEIDNRLQRASGTTPDAQIISSIRQGGFSSSEVDNGISYRRLGGFYQLLVQPANP